MLDPDQDRCSFGPDLGLQNYQQTTKFTASKESDKELIEL